MLWSIDTAAAQPLHEQIAGCARRAISTGELRPDERLPTARELAELLNVNANTVLQAYRVLRSEGFLEFRRGRGVRVGAARAGDASVLEAARALASLGARYGYSRADLARLLTELPQGGRE